MPARNGNTRPLFTAAQLRLMAFAAMAVLLVLSAYTIFRPYSLEDEMVRFTICLLTSLSLSIFFFVFWPQQLELREIPVINLPVRVTGPVVLWVVVFLFLLRLMPESNGNACQFFRPDMAGEQPLAFSARIRLVDVEPKCAYHIVPDEKESSQLGGVYVTFPQGVATVAASLKVPFHKPLRVEFSRSRSTVRMSGLELE